MLDLEDCKQPWLAPPSVPARPLTPLRQPYPSLALDFSPLDPSGEAPWTTARCYRALRPLTAQLTTMRKFSVYERLVESNETSGDKQLGESGHEDSHKRVEREDSDCVLESFRRQRDARTMPTHGRKTPQEDSEDPEWVSKDPNERIHTRTMRTYKRRALQEDKQLPGHQRDEQESPQWPRTWATIEGNDRRYPPLDSSVSAAGLIDFLSHIQICASCSDQKMTSNKTTENENRTAPLKPFTCWTWPQLRPNRAAAREHRRTINRGIITTQSSLHSTLPQQVLSVLGQTQPRSPKSRVGAQSLFRRCLQTVPLYIKQEQLAAQEKDPALAEQVSDQVYADLEAWGSTDPNGWKPLREVVRSQCVALICEAIADKTVPTLDALKMVDDCFTANAVQEGYQLCDAVLTRLPLLPLPYPSLNAVHDLSSIQEMPELAKAYRVLCEHRQFGFFFAKLADLMRNAKICEEHLISEDVAEILSNALISIVREDEHSFNAIYLLNTIMEFSCGILQFKDKQGRPLGPASQDRDLSRPDFAKVLTIILSNLLGQLLVASSASFDTPRPVAARKAVYWLAIKVITFQEVDGKRSPSTPKEWMQRRSMILFAAMLLPAVATRSRIDDDFWAPLRFGRLVAEWADLSTDLDLSEFSDNLAGSVAVHAARLSHLDNLWDCAEQLVDHLESLFSNPPTISPSTILLPQRLRIVLRQNVVAAIKRLSQTAVKEKFPAKSVEHLQDWSYYLELRYGEQWEDPDDGDGYYWDDFRSKFTQELTLYRWEECIGEYVMKTPKPSKTRAVSRDETGSAEFRLWQDPADTRSSARRSTSPQPVSALPETPAPSRSNQENRRHRTSLLDLTDTPAPALPPLAEAEPHSGQEAPSLPKKRQLENAFDGACDDEENELSILTEHGGNREFKKNGYPRKDKPPIFKNPDRQSDALPPITKGVRKAGSIGDDQRPKFRRLVLESSPILRRRHSHDSGGSLRSKKENVKRPSLKRKASAMSHQVDGHSSSGDELAY